MTQSNFTHLMIGAGRMGGAMLKGWTSGRKPIVDADKLLILDPRLGDDANAAVKKGATHIEALSEPQKSLTHVILAIKPQSFDKVAPLIEPYLPKDCLIISVMAGVSLHRMGEAFPGRPLVRAMPNTPASIGKGMMAFTTSKAVSEDQASSVEVLLSAMGEVRRVGKESMIDVVTAVSGSGPAYVFYLTEALAAAAIDLGMSRDEADLFARQTIIGSAALLDKSGESAEDLRIAVTSPGGTTQAALDVLMGPAGMAPIMKTAVRAAFKRAKELS